MKLFRLWKVKITRDFGYKSIYFTYYDDDVFFTKLGAEKYKKDKKYYGWKCRTRSKRVGLIQWLKGEW